LLTGRRVLGRLALRKAPEIIHVQIPERRVDSEAIKSLLRDLPDHSFIPYKPAGHKAVICDEIEASGAKLDEVEAWALDNGGAKEADDPQTGSTPLVAERSPESLPPAPYLVIPFEALE
jgi:hypothetical protein